MRQPVSNLPEPSVGRFSAVRHIFFFLPLVFSVSGVVPESARLCTSAAEVSGDTAWENGIRAPLSRCLRPLIKAGLHGKAPRPANLLLFFGVRPK